MSTSAPDPVCYAFGEFELRPAQRQLLAGGRVLPVGARALDVLTALVERRDRMVSKGELMDIVWPGLVVEENNLQVQVSALRKLLGPDAVVTNPGRGYRFAAHLHEAPGPASDQHRADVGDGAAPPGTSLIGREKDLQALCELVARRRAVTVVGAGGIGKTSLALAAAGALRGAFADGAWVVELAGELDAPALAQTVARVLRIPVAGTGFALDQLVEALASQRLLLVLDNCERVREAASQLVQAICERAQGVHVLATSQEMLHAHDECLFRLAPLEAPAAGDASPPERFGAVCLFVERALRVQGDFALTAANAAAVCEICRRLDGLPLAIELAAARVRLLGVAGLLARLDDRFRLLTGGTRSTVPRHQTLAATIAWSHDLLAEDERRVVRRLGVFVGGFTLELAQAVVGDEALSGWGVVDALGALVDKSLVVCEPGDVQRFRLLESTRAYALERLAEAGERPLVERNHARAMRDLLVRTDDRRYIDVDPLTFEAMMRRLLPEYLNVCAAFDWAAGPGGDLGVAIDLAATSIDLFHALGQTGEAFERARGLLTRLDEPRDEFARARFLTSLGRLGDLGRMTCADMLEASRRAANWFCQAGHRRRAAKARYGEGWILMCMGRLDEAEAAAAELERLLEGPSPVWLRADLTNLRAGLLDQAGRYQESVDLLREHRQMLAHVEGARDIAHRSLNNLCTALNALGRHDDVIALLVPLVETARSDPMLPFAYAELQLLYAQTIAGRLAEARQTIRRAMRRWQRDGYVLFGCFQFALLLAASGLYADAARLDGAGQADVERNGLILSPVRALARSRLLQLLGDAGIEASALERWRQEGRRLSQAEIAALCIDRAA